MILVKIYNREKQFTEILTVDNFYVNSGTGIIRLSVDNSIHSVVYDKYNIDLESHAGIIELDITTSE